MQKGNKLHGGGQAGARRHRPRYNPVRQAARNANRLHVGHYSQTQLEGEYLNCPEAYCVLQCRR